MILAGHSEAKPTMLGVRRRASEEILRKLRMTVCKHVLARGTEAYIDDQYRAPRAIPVKPHMTASTISATPWPERPFEAL
jgi:hypothetical protein